MHQKRHTIKCTANHFGNSGSMEVSGALNIFERFLTPYGLRYTQLLGDGDSRAYKEHVSFNPYGVNIEKLVYRSRGKKDGNTT